MCAPLARCEQSLLPIQTVRDLEEVLELPVQPSSPSKVASGHQPPGEARQRKPTQDVITDAHPTISGRQVEPQPHKNSQKRQHERREY